MIFYTFEGAHGPTYFQKHSDGFFEIYCASDDAIPLRDHSKQFVQEMIELKILVPVAGVPNSCLFVALTRKPYNPNHNSPHANPWIALVPAKQD